LAKRIYRHQYGRLKVRNVTSTRIVETRIEEVLNTGDPLAGIETFFTSTFETIPSTELIGCLLTNTSMDVAIDDKQINKRVLAGLLKIEHAFKQRLLQARDLGELNQDSDIDALAIHLVSCFQGLGVIGKATRDKNRLRQICDIALLALK